MCLHHGMNSCLSVMISSKKYEHFIGYYRSQIMYVSIFCMYD